MREVWDWQGRTITLDRIRKRTKTHDESQMQSGWGTREKEAASMRGISTAEMAATMSLPIDATSVDDMVVEEKFDMDFTPLCEDSVVHPLGSSSVQDDMPMNDEVIATEVTGTINEMIGNVEA